MRQRDVAGGSSTIYRASSRITKLSGIIGGQGQYQAGAASVGARPPAAGDGHQPQPDVSLREERDTETLRARSSTGVEGSADSVYPLVHGREVCV